MKQALHLYKENLKYIENSFKYDINNGVIEGTNNLIKCLKRIAFGYRKYDHFIARIFLIKGIIKEWLKITLYKQFIYQIYCSPTLFDKEPLFLSKIVNLQYLYKKKRTFHSPILYIKLFLKKVSTSLSMYKSITPLSTIFINPNPLITKSSSYFTW